MEVIQNRLTLRVGGAILAGAPDSVFQALGRRTCWGGTRSLRLVDMPGQDETDNVVVKDPSSDPAVLAGAPRLVRK